MESNDGNAHQVQVYVDMTGGLYIHSLPIYGHGSCSHLFFTELISGNISKEVMTWKTTQKGNFVYHEFGLQTPQQFIESNFRIEYGFGYHATALKDGVSFATGAAYTCRKTFETTGAPPTTQDTNFRLVNDGFPVMALSYDLKNMTQTIEPLVFIMGQSRDPLVQYQSPNSYEDRSAFFLTLFEKIEDAVRSFLLIRTCKC